MDFNQVRYFLALADTLNFTRAAERCHVSQPSLTQAIRRLEHELGGELVKREGRYNELTELGNSLRGHFEQIHRTRRLVKATAQAVVSGENTELNIGLMCTVGPRVLSGMLDKFHLSHPLVSIVLHDVVPASIPELLLSGSIDGVFCARHGPPNPKLQYVDLYQESLVVAFPPHHEFSKLDAVPLRDIAGQRYIERLHCEFRKEILELYKEEHLELEVVVRSQREDWIQSLVRDGMGVCCIPEYSLLRPALDHRPITNPSFSRQVELAVAGQGERPPGLDLLIKHASIYGWPSRQEGTPVTG